MTERKYAVKYEVTPGQFTKEELRDSGAGGCDQVLLCSYMEGNDSSGNDDGSGSYCWISSNGKVPHAEMSVQRQFSCLTILAKQLSENESLGPGARRFCAAFFEGVKRAKAEAREHSKK